MPDGADLEHHDADGVGDDVVEFAGDPRALLRNRDASGRLAFTLGSDRADFCCLDLLGAFAERIAGDPGGHVTQRDEDVQARRLLARDVVDHDSIDPVTIARPSHACLSVAQIAEQERRRQPDDAQAPDGRDQRPVDEGDGEARSQ